MAEQPEDSTEIESPDSSEESDVEHFAWRVSKNLERRIDQYLVDRVGYLSRAQVQRVINEGLVKVNGRIAKASYKPRLGDEIEMVAPPEPVTEIVPEPIPLEVIFEDEHFMAINKRAGIMVHPARGKWTGTLVNALIYYGKKWSTVNGNWRPGILHRLDRNTTGVMLVAKSDEAHWRLARQFENRTIQKTYLAVCQGIPELKSDVLDMPIGKDKYAREKQAVRKEENGGKAAVTIYETQETFSRVAASQRDGLPGDTRRAAPPLTERFSFMKLTPKTGRTHQLRVHMSHMGFPMVGDDMYGGKPFIDGDFRFERQALHAFQITFVHPATLKSMTISAPLPPDMEGLLARLRS
ncbi:MAG TPA: RluA family pseudouridine synthase [Tepidisphaeraceae bacterium]|jgi:23S rRNA pseudouridine1911/1915/1917 synthase